MKYVIRKVPERNTAYLERLLPDALIVNDTEHKGAIESFHDALRMADDDAVYVQDDMILCKDFIERTKRYIIRYPDSVIVFCNNTNLKEYDITKEGFWPAGVASWLMCAYIPKAIAQQYLTELETGAWKIKDRHIRGQYDDLNWMDWMKRWNKNVFLTVPNLAGHPSNVSVIDSNRPPRTSKNFDYVNAEPRQEGDEQIDVIRTVIYGGTRNVYKDMVTACKSLLYHRGADRVVFLIEDDEFPEELPECVQCINVSGQKWFNRDNPNCKKRWTWMSLMRCVIPVLPETERKRVLWLDNDTVVMGDLSELWNLPEGPVWMTRETYKTEEYYNAGVLLMDCDALRDDAYKIVHLLNTKELDFPDQDAINEVMKGRIKPLPPEFNVSEWTVKTKRYPKIIHYAAVRNWHQRPEWVSYSKMSWDDVIRKEPIRNVREPFFSVIVPMHNCESYMRKGLDSIKAQTFEDYELIAVCDDCKDRTVEIAREYTDRVFMVKHEKEGMDGLTRNVGIDMARGKYLLFMDDDDWFLDDQAFQTIHDKCVEVDPDLMEMGFVWRGQGYTSPLKKHVYAVWAKCFKREFVGDTRFPSKQYWSDVDFDETMMRKRGNFRKLDVPVYYYNYLREGSTSWRQNVGEIK